MQTGSPSDAQDFFAVAGDLRNSGKRNSRMLVTGTEGAIDNYKLSYGAGGNSEDWKTPRHRHNFEQIRHPLRGDLIIGHNMIVPEGWVSYFPESCWYGPQVRKPDLSMIVLQFAGPSGYGYDTARELRAGMDALTAKGGEFKNGMYSWVDADGKHRNQDAAEAIYEQNRGEKIVYPEPRYDRLLMFNPEAFPWARGARSARRGAQVDGDVHREGDPVRLRQNRDRGVIPPRRPAFGRSHVPQVGLGRGRRAASTRRCPPSAPRPGTSRRRLTAVEEAVLFYAKLPAFGPTRPPSRPDAGASA